VEVSLDGLPWIEAKRTFFVAGLYNLKCYALGRVVFPEARPDDGSAEAALYPSPAAYLKALALGMVGRPSDSDSPAGECRSWRFATIACRDNVQLDGESLPGGEFQVRLESAAYQVLRA
jgi:hypothetical protein